MKGVDAYIAKHPEDAVVLELLREAMLAEGLTETIKWGMPVFTLDGTNIAGIASFKSYIGIWFFNGAALNDKLNVLVNAQEGKTVSQRQWRFQRGDTPKIKAIRQYIHMAKEAGTPVVKKVSKGEIVVPQELRSALKASKEAMSRFEFMSPSHQREYCNYISEAKKPETRIRRAERVMKMITGGTVQHDKYMNKDK